MTNAPTTRDAELAGVIKYLRREAATNKAKRSGQAHGAHFVTRARKLNKTADALETLLSEIAAMRGRENELIATHAVSVMQIERQRDELRKALERIADEAPYRSGYCQSDVEYGPALSADEMQAVARQALSNQGGEQ